MNTQADTTATAIFAEGTAFQTKGRMFIPKECFRENTTVDTVRLLGFMSSFREDLLEHESEIVPKGIIRVRPLRIGGMRGDEVADIIGSGFLSDLWEAMKCGKPGDWLLLPKTDFDRTHVTVFSAFYTPSGDGWRMNSYGPGGRWEVTQGNIKQQWVSR